jgi:hypothetical protein
MSAGAAAISAGAGSTEDDDAGARLDAGMITSDAGSTSHLSPPPVDAGSAPTMTDGGLTCENLVCFDIFDCLIFYAAEFGPCKFTKCEGLICKP